MAAGVTAAHLGGRFFIKEYLESGEAVIKETMAVSWGNWTYHQGKLYLTNRRVVFLSLVWWLRPLEWWGRRINVDLTRINLVDKTRKRIPGLWPLPLRMAVLTLRTFEQDYFFRVSQIEQWVEAIGRARD